MHPELVKAYVDRVRRRVSERDCCVTPPVSIENLEDVIIELAGETDRPTLTPTQPDPIRADWLRADWLAWYSLHRPTSEEMEALIEWARREVSNV